MARSTEIKVKKADAVPNLESISNVRGSEEIQQMMKMTTPKLTERHAIPSLSAVIVLRYLAPTRTCKAYRLSMGEKDLLVRLANLDELWTSASAYITDP